MSLDYTCIGANCTNPLAAPTLGGPLLYFNTSLNNPLGVAAAMLLGRNDVNKYPKGVASTYVRDLVKAEEERKLTQAPWELLASYEKNLPDYSDISSR